VKKFVIRTNLPQFFANLRFQGHRVDLPLLQTVLIEPFFPVVEKYERSIWVLRPIRLFTFFWK